jgi:prepilin-type N-terminal cleavage/methylation domain-containing protein/prepilin-type processing-associated H-X9-DG protein
LGFKQKGKRMKDTQLKNEKGFTLIELLVVISIIALLLSILMPGLQKAKEKAQTTVCMSNIKQWNLMVRFFLDDNDGAFPDSDWNDDGSNDPHGQWWIQPLKQYNDNNKEILLCAKASTNPGENYAGDEGRPNEFHPVKNKQCWGSRDGKGAPTAGKWTYASYAPNAWIMNTREKSWGRALDGKFWGKAENVTSPYQVPLFLDSRWVDVWPMEDDYPNDAEHGGTGGQGSMRQLTHTRHGKVTNIVYCDGSAGRVKLTELWGQKWHRTYNTNNDQTKPGARWPDWIK